LSHTTTLRGELRFAVYANFAFVPDDAARGLITRAFRTSK